ncbi:MAG: STAS domain-containing protein [Gammaproteobacteria bacterium]|nr:STAS domain-containing protein [Gammaproteobacteria bacterium]
MDRESTQEEVQSTLAKFEISDVDIQMIRQAGESLSGRLGEMIDEFYRWLRQQEEFGLFFGDNASNLERVMQKQLEIWERFFEGRVDLEYFEARRQIGAVHEAIGLPNDIYCAGMSVSENALQQMIQETDADAADKQAMSRALAKLIDLDTYLALDEIALLKNFKILEQSRSVMEMSTPVTPIWEGILLLPLLGIIDTARTQDIMEKSLTKIAESEAKVFVLDISGVSTVDTAVANQLLKVTRATELMGCSSIISGISPAIAKTLVELGISTGEVRTTATLKDAFEIALTQIGVDLSQAQS